MRILLTGGSGMVGKNFLEHQAVKDLEVIAPTSSELNLLDYSGVEVFLSKYKPDMIIHTAGRVGGIQANIKEPVRFLLENLDMGRNIVWAARKIGVKRLINLGSSCMYPRNAANPLREDMVLKGELEPTNEGYALAKITVSRLCCYISRENPTYEYKTLIPCNLYGRWDKFHPDHSHLIPAVIHKIHQAKTNGCDQVEIWGDGTARREFMYAGDMADCLVQALNKFMLLPDLMNVGLGYDYTVNEYYETAGQVIGYMGKFVHDLSKPVGMQRKVVSIEKQKEWGWSPRTELRKGFEAAYEYYLHHYLPGTK